MGCGEGSLLLPAETDDMADGCTETTNSVLKSASRAVWEQVFPACSEEAGTNFLSRIASSRVVE